MRIDRINVPQTNSVVSPSSDGEVKPSTTDRSSGTLPEDTANLRDVSGLVAKAMEQPEVRQEKVASIKSQIEAGTYKVDASEIADALISSALREG